MIVVVDRIPEPERHQAILSERMGTTVPFYERMEDANLADAEIIVGPSGQVTVADLDRAPKLRWYHALSAGVNGLPLATIAERGILLSNSGGIHQVPMAEHAFGLMLMFARNLHNNVRNSLTGKWSRGYRQLSELSGTTLCIVGAGRIGDAVAARAKAFGMQVIGVKRSVQADASYPNYDRMTTMADLLDVLPESDWVLLLVPLTAETNAMFGARELAAMKSSAVLVNLARGNVVDEDALIEALETGRIAGAGLDVFRREPLPPDSPLWRMENVIVTPHVGGSSHLYYDRAFQLFLDNYAAYRRGDRLPTAINLELGY